LTSKIIPKDVLDRFTKEKSRLKKDLSLEYHVWYLRTWDEGSIGVLKVQCVECRQDFDRGTWDQNTATVTNLFSNFKKSLMFSTKHIQSYCRKRRTSE
jgi:hypothetical protein